MAWATKKTVEKVVKHNILVLELIPFEREALIAHLKLHGFDYDTLGDVWRALNEPESDND